MTSPSDEPPTILDPGRRRRGDGDITQLDPGRTRPVSSGGPTLAEGLPPLLDARFKIVRRLSRAGAHADVLLVQERASGAELVVKLCAPGLDEQVGAFLMRRPSRHIVQVTETGTAGGRGYEIMEYLAGGSLTQLRDSNPTGLDTSALTSIVRQVARALAALHANDIVHRDVKPSNILVRTLTPFEVALIDLGISQHIPARTTFATEESGTVRYMPPEFISGRLLSPAFDWWSLGVSVLELATGHPLLDGLDDDNAIRVHVAGGPLNVSTVVDPRVRLLCQGLLAQSVESRWGAAEVEAWLQGKSPPVPAAFGAPAADEAEAAAEPFVYLDTAYRHRGMLAANMTATWETAVDLCYRHGPEQLRRLEDWLRQFPEPNRPDGSDEREPDDVRLLRLLRAMAPAHPPIYRGLNIAWRTLPELARQAAGGEGNLPEIVRELWAYDLLPLLAGGAETADLGGGSGLAQVRARWGQERRRWRAAAGSITDRGARRALAGSRRAQPEPGFGGGEHASSSSVRAQPEPAFGEGEHAPSSPRSGADRRARREADDRMTALCLYAATADDETRARVRHDLVVLERAVRLDWFTDLVRRPEGMWLAYRLRRYAQECAAERDAQERAAAQRRAWLNRTRTFREWSRRQNRPLALSWAVAGVFVMAVVCTVLVGTSDLAGVVPDATILDAWLATVLAAAVALTFEALLAWEIGGRFHPRYSILGAGMIALGRAARSIAGRGIALAVVAGCLAGGYALTVFAPVLTPVVAGGGVIVWAVGRFLAWRGDSGREQADAERGAREGVAAGG